MDVLGPASCLATISMLALAAYASLPRFFRVNSVTLGAARALLEVGFEWVRQKEGLIFLRKRK